MTIPTKREAIVDEIEGVRVADPYRWLEDSQAPDVREWIANCNAQVDGALKGDAFRRFSDELAKNFKFVQYSNPLPVQGTYFYTERQPDEDQAVLYMKKGLDGTPVKLVDPNGKREGNTITIDYWMPSQSGRYLAYGISEGGDEMATLYVQDTETVQNLSEKIVHCRYSSIRWLPDDSAFFYTRNPRPGTVPKNEEHLHTKVYLHVLGTDPDADALIFGADRPKDDMTNIGISPDGRYVSIFVSRTWTENDVYIYDRESDKVQPLIVGVPSIFSLVFLQDKLLLKTNYKANNHRVLWATYEEMHKPLDAWEEFIPEREFVLESLRVTKSKILAEYLVNACSEVRTFDYEGNATGNIPLPEYSSLAGIASRKEEEEFFYGVESFVFPKMYYRYDPVADAYVAYRKTDNPIRSEDYTVKQEWYSSKDGTKVPMFILHKKGIQLDGTNPTILYGYGGFGNNETPAFLRNWVPWIEQGGVFAIANIRGGGEFGEKWHKGGIQEQKQNTFDDFIAAGEYLVSHRYTDVSHLGILGGSNGGLLVSAVGVQRPDLCSAACARVPLTDMVRFPLFGIAIRWIHEYGNPAVKEDLARILQWSPYHNVQQGVKYPDFFFMTANKDTRVDPLHARKMAAQLQWARDDNAVLMFTEMDAGHGSGKPVIKVVENQALVLSFFAQKLG